MGLLTSTPAPLHRAVQPDSRSSRTRDGALILLPFLLQGIGYGFSAAVQPGPFQTYLISQTLLNGWRRTLIAALAPLVSDGLIILTVLLVLTRVPPAFRLALQLAGGVFILYLAWGAFRAWRRFDVVTPPTPAAGAGAAKPAARRVDELPQPQPLDLLEPGHGAHLDPRLGRIA